MQKRLASKTLIGLGLLAAVLLVSACGQGRDSDPSTEVGQSRYGKLVRVRGGAYRTVTPVELAEMRQAQELYLVNVHIPYEGEIEPTDAFIPFSEIEKHLDELPPSKNAAIVLYCRSGVMSADAARVLAGLGYTGIYSLRGGTNAWNAAGYPVVVKAR